MPTILASVKMILRLGYCCVNCISFFPMPPAQVQLGKGSFMLGHRIPTVEERVGQSFHIAFFHIYL